MSVETIQAQLRGLMLSTAARELAEVLARHKKSVGKTHIAIAIGVRAARAGHRVWWTSAKRLVQQIVMAKARNSLDAFFKQVLSAELWIIDDWGVVRMSREVSEEVFDLMDRRRYNSSMILTSNRAVEEWGAVFPDSVVANATIDRIFDRAEVLEFPGKSYRLKRSIQETGDETAQEDDEKGEAS